MSSSPRVSVIVSTYNRYDRLVEALASVALQTYPGLEVVVVNDGSSDPGYANGARPAGIKWIDLPRNTRETHGYPCLGYVRNVGIRHSTGDYLAFLDDDDVWMPEKIERQIEALEGTDVQMCSTEVFATDGAPREDLHYPLYYREVLGLDLPAHLTLDHVREKNYVTHSSVIMRRDLFDKAGPYLEIPLHGYWADGLNIVEDWELWRSCLKHTRCRYLSEPLGYHDCKYGVLGRWSSRARIAVLRGARSLLGRPRRIRVVYR